MIAPLDTPEFTEGGEAVGVRVAMLVTMLALVAMDEVVAAADIELDRKSAAAAGSFDKKAGTKSSCRHWLA